jgi:hypothetical protein
MYKQNYSQAYLRATKAEFLSQNTTLLFNKSATCFGYCQQPLSERSQEYKEKDITQLQYVALFVQQINSCV